MVKCDECGCEAPAHYGSCSIAPAGMAEVFARLVREAAERRARDADRAARITATGSRLVREALRSLANEPGCGDLFGLLAQSASDEALSKLGRLLK